MAWQNQAWTGLAGGPDANLLKQVFSSLTDHLRTSAHSVWFELWAARSYPAPWIVPTLKAEAGTGEVRTFFDATHFPTVRMHMNVYTGTGVAGSYFCVQYTTDLTGAGGWTDLDTATNLAIDTGGHKVSFVGSVPAPARTEILLRGTLLGGNGVATADITYVGLEFRPSLP